MPDISNYTFELREVTELLIKTAGLREGTWMLSINLTFTAGNFQNAADSAMPGALVGIQNFGLSKVDSPGAPSNLAVDAATLQGKTKK